jgi:hypothetical protein
MSQIVQGKKISDKRMQRIVREVAPLVARGLNIYDIAERVGISSVMAYHDVTLVRQMWIDNSKEELEAVRARGIAEWDELYQTAREGYDASRKEGRRDPKLLSAAATALRERQKLQGLAADVTLTQTNIHLHGEASTEEVLSTFAPMSAEDYASLTEAGASLTHLPPSAGHSGALERHSQAVEAIQSANEEEPSWGDPVAIHSGHSQEPAKTAGTAHSQGSKPITNPIAASR